MYELIVICIHLIMTARIKKRRGKGSTKATSLDLRLCFVGYSMDLFSAHIEHNDGTFHFEIIFKIPPSRNDCAYYMACRLDIDTFT
jgi:hypothetical protein